MREYKYDYTISKENDPEEFKRICSLLEHRLEGYDKAPLLVDVDGSTIQIFSKGETEILVFDDYDIGAVFVKSDIDLSEIIGEKKVA